MNDAMLSEDNRGGSDRGFIRASRNDGDLMKDQGDTSRDVYLSMPSTMSESPTQWGRISLVAFGSSNGW